MEQGAPRVLGEISSAMLFHFACALEMPASLNMLRGA
jgi:hypothetical protein